MYVTLDHVISFSKSVVKEADNIDQNLWREWIYYGALLHLGISDEEIDVAEITPKQLLAPLPPNCRHILELSLFDSGGNQLSHKYRTGVRRIYSDQRITSTATASSNSLVNNGIPVDVSNDHYNIVLGTNGTIVSKIMLRYFKYPVDANEQPLIREEDMMACMYFVKHMTSIRNNQSRSEIDQFWKLWALHRDMAKAAKKMNSMTEEKAKTVLQESMRMIPQFSTKLF